MIWVSINVTNCSDGVDGLCGNLSIITLLNICLIFIINQQPIYYIHISLLMITTLLGYLWFNTTPSRILMGDAGSRALGLFISIMILKTCYPLLFIFVAFMLIVDGGLGIIKVFLLRFLNINILKKIRTPIHDFARITLGWSDSQVVFRFVTIQIIISVISLYLLINSK